MFTMHKALIDLVILNIHNLTTVILTADMQTEAHLTYNGEKILNYMSISGCFPCHRFSQLQKNQPGTMGRRNAHKIQGSLGYAVRPYLKIPENSWEKNNSYRSTN